MANTTTKKNLRGGYKVAVLGSTVGLVIGVLLVGFSLAIITGAFGLLRSGQLTSNTLLMLAELSLLGAPFGCGVALSRARQPGAAKTAVLLAGFLIVAVAAVQPILVERGAETLWASRILILLGVLITTCAARGLVLTDGRNTAKRMTL